MTELHQEVRSSETLALWSLAVPVSAVVVRVACATSLTAPLSVRIRGVVLRREYYIKPQPACWCSQAVQSQNMAGIEASCCA